MKELELIWGMIKAIICLVAITWFAFLFITTLDGTTNEELHTMIFLLFTLFVFGKD